MSAVKSKSFTQPNRRYLDLIRKFPLRPIRTKTEAAAATAILDRLFGREDTDPGEAAYVDVLSDLLDAFEKKTDPDESEATGVQVLRALMQEHRIKQADLAAKLRLSAPTISLILSSQRPITVGHARNLAKLFAVDPGVFVTRS
ncbi:MAG: helix-turn-helix domain-containing protein [Tepidisphaeraceae bacterium]|jgi:HTH-type transcriptional regulator/antitoxin HigA